MRFFVRADYPNTPLVRLTVWIFLSRLTLAYTSEVVDGIGCNEVAAQRLVEYGESSLGTIATGTGAYNDGNSGSVFILYRILFFLKKYQNIWWFDFLSLILHIDKRRIIYAAMFNLKLITRNRHKINL